MMEVEEADIDDGEGDPWATPTLIGPPPALSLDDLALMRAVADESLYTLTGVRLPEWTETPIRAQKETHHRELNVMIPVGDLLYPCCGDDTADAIAMFGRYARVCHFADPIHPPWMNSHGGSEQRWHELPHVGRVLLGPERKCERQVSGVPVVGHQRDGLLTLIQLNAPLAVFYYRGAIRRRRPEQQITIG